MSYVSEVEAFLGTRLSDTWRRVADVLYTWACSPFHAAILIHWMMHEGRRNDEVVVELQRLAEESTKLNERIKLLLWQIKRQIRKSAQQSVWETILAAAQRAGMSLKEISALFEGFLDGLILPQAVSDPAAALSAIQQSHSKYRI